MPTDLRKAARAAANTLGVVTLSSVALLLVSNAFPNLFRTDAHDLLGALPLALIALTYLVFQATRRRTGSEMVKATLLAIAFLLWAANQYWPTSPRAVLLNDLAIALFVWDLLLVIRS